MLVLRENKIVGNSCFVNHRGVESFDSLDEFRRRHLLDERTQPRHDEDDRVLDGRPVLVRDGTLQGGVLRGREGRGVTAGAVAGNDADGSDPGGRGEEEQHYEADPNPILEDAGRRTVRLLVVDTRHSTDKCSLQGQTAV